MFHLLLAFSLLLSSLFLLYYLQIKHFTVDYQTVGRGLIIFSAIELSIIRLLTKGNYRTINYLTNESNDWTIDYSNQKKSFDVQFCPLEK